MINQEQNSIFLNPSSSYLEEYFTPMRAMLSYALNLSESEIKISFPALNDFKFINGVYKAPWAIFIHQDKLPKLLYAGNFLIQGGTYSQRATKSVFGMQPLLELSSLANTFSQNASYFKQNWTLDLNLIDEVDSEKLRFSLKEYKEFLKLLNKIRSQWLLHLSEEGNIDFVIIEFSEPSDQLFFIDLENIDSLASTIKTYFKPISPKALTVFQQLSKKTEFEGKFYNLQPGTWLRDDVMIEIKDFHSNASGAQEVKVIKDQLQESDYGFLNPFRVQAFKI